MKTSALFCLLFFSFTAFAEPQPEPGLRCREYEPAPEMGPEKIIAYDLTHGLWLPEGEDSNTIQFNDDGTAVMFSEGNGRTTATFMIWSVNSVDGLPQLSTINSADGSLRQYVVTTDCEGMNLLNTATWEMHKLLYRPTAASSSLKELEADLRGEWTAYASRPGAGRPQAVRINFLKDNKFTRLLDMGPERGVWELSKDGKFLLLHTWKRNQPTGCGSTTVYRLNYCDDHSLQMEPVATPRINEMEEKQLQEGLLSFIK